MLTDLRNRFDRYTDASSHMLDPVFIAATALDPRYKNQCLNALQKESAKAYLISEVRKPRPFEVIIVLTQYRLF